MFAQKQVLKTNIVSCSEPKINMTYCLSIFKIKDPENVK